MFLGIDGRFMSVPGGLGRYTRELVLEMARQNPGDHFTVIVKPETQNLPEARNVEYVEVDIPWYGIREQIQLGLIMNRMKRVETWFIPHWNVPLFLFTPFVFTIHDFIFENFPTYGEGFFAKYFFIAKWVVWRFMLNVNVRRAKGIITVSEFVKKEITDRFPWAAGKTTAIHLGISPPSLVDSQTNMTPFFMMVGNSYPHKNQRLATEVYKNHPDFSVPLYIFTHRDRFSTALANEIENQKLTDRIKIFFDVTDSELATHYRGAAALIFPSLSEGFGFPPLEAFAFGTPAIVSHTSVMPEILQNMPHWISAENSEELYAEMKKISDAPITETERATLRAFVAQFSWKKTALSTRNFLQTVLYS